MGIRLTPSAVVATTLAVCAASTPALSDPLVAVESDTGNIYTVDSGDASLGFVGGTGVSGFGALEFNPHDGSFYAMSTGASAALYQVDISPTLDAVEGVELVGELGAFKFEGGLAFGPDGTAYGVNAGITLASLFSLDLSTGEATIIGTILENGDERHDIAGLAWRSDGMLLALDSTDQQLGLIDPATAALQHLADVNADIGSVGGMTMLNGVGYFNTAGPNAARPGSNELYSFDPFTGAQVRVGDFDDSILGTGFSGLSIVPEPTTLAILAVGGVSLLARGRRRPGCSRVR